MDDELEINIAVSKAPQPRKASVPKDGGAKHGNRVKPIAKPAKAGQGNKSSHNKNITPVGKRDGKPPDRPQQQHRQQPASQKPAAKAFVKPRTAKDPSRPKQKPGKQRFQRSAGGRADDPDDPDELLRAEAPDEEVEEDIMAAVSMAATREAALRSENNGNRAPAAELEGVVEFDDDDDDGGGGNGGRKRRRLNHPGAHKSSDGTIAVAAKGTGNRGKLAPGSFVHAATTNAGAAAAATTTTAEGSVTDASSWTGLRLSPALCGRLEALGFAAPTSIQSAVLPVLLSGRDALVRAQTGSGKTLSYLLPLIQDLQSAEPRISRGEGTYGLVVAPTRELCLQVADVAGALLRPFHWLVAGLLIGGEHRGHEKARLRKGVTLLVATPGRLMDHLESTMAFRTSELRWLVLDEADRLLDLGFESKLAAITQLLNSRSGAASGGAGTGQEGGKGGGKAAGGRGAPLKPQPGKQQPQSGGRQEEEEEEEEGGEAAGGGQKRRVTKDSQGRNRAAGGGADGGGGSGGAERRQTVLVSATLHRQLGALAELALKNPAVVGFQIEQSASGPKLLTTSLQLTDGTPATDPAGDGPSTFSLPASLRQTWLEVPAKERLVALAALLRSRTARRRVGGTKLVVFLSSCDGVEYHYTLLGGLWAGVAGAPLLPRTCPLFKLHGDMPQAQRTETFAGFAKEGDGVLLCTDVAARGLDFPNVTTIIQYDVPGAPEEYVHRVGRSARMGAVGEAVLFLLPHEVPYAQLLRSRGVLLEQEPLDGLARWMPAPALDSGGSSKRSRGSGSDGAARQVAQMLHRQLAGAVARDTAVGKLAQDAFRSFVRAYAVHRGDLKRVFNPRLLHLGHIAHAFCLSETPSMLGSSGSAADRKRRKREEAAAADAHRRRKMKVAARKITGE